MPFPQMFDDIVQVAVDIVVRGQEPLRPRGRAPVDQVGVESGFDEVRHDAAAFLEIDDVGRLTSANTKQNGVVLT